MVLSTMRITKAVDRDGVPIEAEVQYTNAIVKSVPS